MKNPVLVFAMGLSVAALGWLAYAEIRRKNEKAAAQSNLSQLVGSASPAATMKFRGFNFQTLLNSQTKQALPEVTALQHMINAYYNGSDSIDVTGVFDQQTRNAVKAITGKTSTTLFEFQFQYLIKERSEKVANDLITSITITG